MRYLISWFEPSPPASISVREINLVPRAFPGKALGTSCVRTLPLSQAYSERKTMINVLLVLMKLWTTLRTFSTSESALSPPVLPWRCQSRDSSDCKLKSEIKNFHLYILSWLTKQNLITVTKRNVRESVGRIQRRFLTLGRRLLSSLGDQIYVIHIL